MNSETRMCVVCGISVPASHDRSEAWPECPAKDACTFDMTPSEAADHWRNLAHQEREQNAALEKENQELRDLVGIAFLRGAEIAKAVAKPSIPFSDVEREFFATYGYSTEIPKEVRELKG